MIYTKPEEAVYLQKGYYNGVYIYIQCNEEEDDYKK